MGDDEESGVGRSPVAKQVFPDTPGPDHVQQRGSTVKRTWAASQPGQVLAKLQPAAIWWRQGLRLELLLGGGDLKKISLGDRPIELVINE